MAEAVGLVASTIAIAGLGVKLSLGLREAVSDIKSAAIDVHDIATSISMLSSTLRHVGKKQRDESKTKHEEISSLRNEIRTLMLDRCWSQRRETMSEEASTSDGTLLEPSEEDASLHSSSTSFEVVQQGSSAGDEESSKALVLPQANALARLDDFLSHTDEQSNTTDITETTLVRSEQATQALHRPRPTLKLKGLWGDPEGCKVPQIWTEHVLLRMMIQVVKETEKEEPKVPDPSLRQQQSSSRPPRAEADPLDARVYSAAEYTRRAEADPKKFRENAGWDARGDRHERRTPIYERRTPTYEPRNPISKAPEPSLSARSRAKRSTTAPLKRANTSPLSNISSDGRDPAKVSKLRQPKVQNVSKDESRDTSQKPGLREKIAHCFPG
ncbi:MAG: hypothetical protein MMC23_002495 [Stictis urceolatum]|nr:hypothetical protein [Stictis urceolata]